MKYAANMTIDLEDNQPRYFDVCSPKSFEHPEVLNNLSTLTHKIHRYLKDLSRESIFSFANDYSEIHYHKGLLFDVCHDCAEVRLITTGEKPIVIKDEFHSINFLINIPCQKIKIYICHLYAFVIDAEKQELHMTRWY